MSPRWRVARRGADDGPLATNRRSTGHAGDCHCRWVAVRIRDWRRVRYRAFRSARGYAFPKRIGLAGFFVLDIIPLILTYVACYPIYRGVRSLRGPARHRSRTRWLAFFGACAASARCWCSCITPTALIPDLGSPRQADTRSIASAIALYAQHCGGLPGAIPARTVRWQRNQEDRTSCPGLSCSGKPTLKGRSRADRRTLPKLVAGATGGELDRGR